MYVQKHPSGQVGADVDNKVNNGFITPRGKYSMSLY